MSSPGELPFDAAEYEAQPSSTMAMVPRTPAANLQGLIRIVHQSLRGRYWFLIPISVVLGALGGIVGWKCVQPHYTSEGNIQIQNQTITFHGDSTGYFEQMSMYDEVLQTQCTIVKSRTVIEQALKNPVWAANHREAVDATTIQRFVENLSVEHPGRTQTIRIAYTDVDAGTAAAAVKAVVLAYKTYFQAQQEHASDDVFNALRERDAQLDAGISSEKAELEKIFKTVNNQRVDTLQASKQAELTRVDDLIHRIEVAQNLAKNRPGGSGDLESMTVGQIGLIDAEMRIKLTTRDNLEATLRDFRSRYGPNNPEIHKLESNLKVKIEEIEAYAREYRDNTRREMENADPNNLSNPDAFTRLLRSDPKTLEEKMGKLEEIRARSQQEVSELTGKLVETRRHEAKLAEMQLQRDKDERLAQQMHAEERLKAKRLSIISEGEIPISPSKDRRKMACGGLGLAGFLLPLGLAVCGTSISRKFRFSDDADALDHLPSLLGILPALPEPVTDPEQASIASHCVHQIRIMLQIISRRSGQKTSRVHVITSASTGDGKTNITMALGLSFASSGSRTLLIDCDMIGRGLTSRLRASQSPGLLESLHAASLQGNIKKTSTKNLYVLPVGGVGDHPNVGSLSPDTLRRLLAEARRIFDVIIVDTGPVLGSLEAQMAASVVDGVVLAVSRGQSQSLVHRSLRQLQNVGANVIGLIFNKAEKNDFQRSVSSNSRKSTRSQRSTSSRPDQQQRPLPADAKPRSGFGPLAGAVAAFLPGTEQTPPRPPVDDLPRNTVAPAQPETKAPPVPEAELFDTVMGHDAISDSDDSSNSEKPV